MKLKKASLTILNEIRVKVSPQATLEHVLIEVASLTPERAAIISKQVQDSLQETKKPSIGEKSKDFRSFLKQQK